MLPASSITLAKLHQEATARVRNRSDVESRWLEDLNLYYGNYQPALVKSLEQHKRSTLFINALRSKCTTLAAKLGDMLFPTDDRNYGIRATPSPEIDGQNQEDREALNAYARQAASKMEDEIHDVLIECDYAEQCRMAIEDACKLGIGIIKGPILSDEGRQAWQYDPESGTHVLGWRQDIRPTFWRVDPWAYFPNQQGNGTYERHILFPDDLRALGKDENYAKPALRRLLKDGPQDNLPTYYNDLRDINESGMMSDADNKCYVVWEYHGSISQADLSVLAKEIGDSSLIEDLSSESDDIDPLYEPTVILWFTEKEVLRLGLHYLDSGESVYSVFNIDPIQGSDFGSGLMRISRDAQLAISAAWRAMMDNASLTSGPNIVIDPTVVDPADGSMVLSGRKIWLRKNSMAPTNNRSFEIFNFTSNQVEMANIIEMAKRSMEEETGVSGLTQGDQAKHVTKTASGLSILASASNIVFRRYVKFWDDKITIPTIRRLYDFLMQFSDKADIKGDFNVEARGTSVLLVRELQSTNLFNFLMTFGIGTPYQEFLKENGLPVLRKLLQSLTIPSDEVLKSAETIELEMQQQAQAEQSEQTEPVDSTLAVAQLRAQTEESKLQLQAQIAEMEINFKIMELSEKTNQSVEKIAGALEKQRMANDSKERILVAEASYEKDKQLNGSTSGSGGYL